METTYDQCVDMLEAAGVVHVGDLVAWRKVFAEHQLDFELVAMGMSYLSLVSESKRKECFEMFGFSPSVGEFTTWAVRNGYDFEVARRLSWMDNADTGYSYEGGDFLVLVDGVVDGGHCSEAWRFLRSTTRVGPIVASLLHLPVESVAECDEDVTPVLEVGVNEVVEEVVSSEVTLVDDADFGYHDAGEEAVCSSAYLLVFQEDVREDAFNQLGLAPSLTALLSAEFPFVSESLLEGLDLVVDGVVFDVSRYCGGFGNKVGFLGLLQRVCRENMSIAVIRLAEDGVDYGKLTPDTSVLSRELLWECMVYNEPICDFPLGRERTCGQRCGTGFVSSCADFESLQAVEPGIRCALQRVMEVSPALEDLIGLVQGRFIDYQADAVRDATDGDLDSVVYIRFWGSGVDRITDGVWVGLESASDTGPKHPWFRRAAFGSGGFDLNARHMVSCRAVTVEQVPGAVVVGAAKSPYGYTFVKMNFSRSVVARAIELCATAVPEPVYSEFALLSPYSSVLMAIVAGGFEGLDANVDHVVGLCFSRKYTEQSVGLFKASALANDVVHLTVEQEAGYGSYVEALRGGRELGGGYRLGVLVAWYVWLARRGELCDLKFEHVRGDWVCHRNVNNAYDAALIDLISTLAQKVFLEETRDAYLIDKGHIEERIGMRFLGRHHSDILTMHGDVGGELVFKKGVRSVYGSNDLSGYDGEEKKFNFELVV